MEDKKLKVEFAPGCFDSFEGTQEELDELMTEIQRLVDSGEIFETATAIDIDDLLDEDPEWAERLINSADPRNLQ
jgi:uncharacterized protein YqgV (UPF0045/DUF77 family)